MVEPVAPPDLSQLTLRANAERAMAAALPALYRAWTEPFDIFGLARQARC